VSLTEMESTIDRMLALMRKISLLDGKETPPA
jgi:hypothetical protein